MRTDRYGARIGYCQSAGCLPAEADPSKMKRVRRVGVQRGILGGYPVDLCSTCEEELKERGFLEVFAG